MGSGEPVKGIESWGTTELGLHVKELPLVPLEGQLEGNSPGQLG